MGGSHSLPIPSPHPQLSSSPPKPVSCAVRKVELNQIQNDLKQKQNEVDTCDPQGSQARQTQAAIAANQAYVDSKKNEQAEAYNEYVRQRKLIQTFSTSLSPIQQYTESLREELSRLEKENVKFEQEERMQRRNFLDNDPQGGVYGLPGVRTYDDKVLLAFWITYGATILCFCLVAFSQTSMSLGEKIGTIVAILLVCYGLAYYAITTYG